MAPVDQPKHVDVWMCIRHNKSLGQFYLDTSTTGAEYGPGFYATEKGAKQYQLMCLLKDQHLEIFHLEMPI